MDYEQVIRETLSGEMPQVYTTIKAEQQSEENMMGVIRARSRKATVLPREYGPINWYNAPADLHGQPFRFPWSSDFIKKMINACLRISPHARPDYKFKFIQVPNRYRKKPVGYPHWTRQGAPRSSATAFRLRQCIQMDMPLPLLDMVNQVLGAEMRSEWDEECLNLEVSNFEVWRQAFTL